MGVKTKQKQIRKIIINIFSFKELYFPKLFFIKGSIIFVNYFMCNVWSIMAIILSSLLCAEMWRKSAL